MKCLKVHHFQTRGNKAQLTLRVCRRHQELCWMESQVRDTVTKRKNIFMFLIMSKSLIRNSTCAVGGTTMVLRFSSGSWQNAEAVKKKTEQDRRIVFVAFHASERSASSCKTKPVYLQHERRAWLICHSGDV